MLFFCASCASKNIVDSNSIIFFPNIDYSDVLENRSTEQLKKVTGTSINIQFESNISASQALKKYEEEFSDSNNPSEESSFVYNWVSTNYIFKKLEIISKYGLLFDHLVDIEYPYSYFTYYCPSVLSLSEIQYEIEKKVSTLLFFTRTSNLTWTEKLTQMN